MKKYLIKRLVGTIPVLIGVTVLCFILMTVSGKDPAMAAALRSNSAGNTVLVESLREEMGLDKPLPIRYLLWLKGLLTGDLGRSAVTYHNISDDIITLFPVTFRLVIMAMGWLIIIVIPVSMLCARFHNKLFDHIVRVLSIGGICLPVFWLGFMLLLLFAVKMPIFSVVPKSGITIARAILKNAPIIILDEATAYTDAENEELITNALNELTKGRTVIMIAHRLGTIADADNIVVLDGGRVSANGTHNELMNKSSIYSRLWQMSLEAGNWNIAVKEGSIFQ